MTFDSSQATQVAPAAPRGKSRIFLVDDHAMFREGLRQLIDREPDFIVSGDAADVEEALKGIGDLLPDLVITDISLSGTSGIDLIKTLKSRHPELPVLVVSMHEETLYAERALRAGAMGYVMKQEPAKAVKAAIRKVLGGDIHLSEKMASAMLGKLIHKRADEKPVSPIESLSNRELEVFRMLGEGKTSREIAEKLDLSIATINSFRNR
ncbi:MAG TPA: DNA-binding response regulator, partial [Verrucomicrobia subdivision 3 bacterium]|nr:DNA-binding response regulator [Limisphaerales bacterium]